MTKPAIEVQNLQKSYGQNHVLRGVNFQVERGSMLALLGPNGAGKTTTVRILSTLLPFDSGRVIVDGHDWPQTPTPFAARSASPANRPPSTSSSPGAKT